MYATVYSHLSRIARVATDPFRTFAELLITIHVRTHVLYLTPLQHACATSVLETVLLKHAHKHLVGFVLVLFWMF